MGNFGIGEMTVIAIFALLVFGPQRLPEIARSVGGFIREFRDVTGNLSRKFKEEIDGESTRARPLQANGSVRVTGEVGDAERLA